MTAGAPNPIRAVLAVTACVLFATAAAFAAAPAITADGAGKVKLGAKASALRQAGLIGKVRRGCELAPHTRAAKLKPPLKGSVNFTQSTPRRVDNIAITGGAKASGVGVGSRKRKIKAAFPRVKFDHGTDDVFGITLAKVPRSNGGKLQFAVDVQTKRVTLIGVPFIAFCE
jgi:hypothetical protein